MPFPRHDSRARPSDPQRRQTEAPSSGSDYAELAYWIAQVITGADLLWALDARLRVDTTDRSPDGSKASRTAFAAINKKLSVRQQLRVGTAVGVYEMTRTSPLPILAMAAAVLFWIVYVLIALF
ncbi:MAG TPA: hypothetical protein VFQ88_09550 [Nevskiaceae bacterium]|nr:hypothetical protein [Nevskiaceae bacterium]